MSDSPKTVKLKEELAAGIPYAGGVGEMHRISIEQEIGIREDEAAFWRAEVEAAQATCDRLNCRMEGGSLVKRIEHLGWRLAAAEQRAEAAESKLAARDAEWSDALWPENPEGAPPETPESAKGHIKALMAYELAASEAREGKLREAGNRMISVIDDIQRDLDMSYPALSEAYVLLRAALATKSSGGGK